jgi:hypothetical protein
LGQGQAAARDDRGVGREFFLGPFARISSLLFPFVSFEVTIVVSSIPTGMIGQSTLP